LAQGPPHGWAAIEIVAIHVLFVFEMPACSLAQTIFSSLGAPHMPNTPMLSLPRKKAASLFENSPQPPSIFKYQQWSSRDRRKNIFGLDPFKTFSIAFPPAAPAPFEDLPLPRPGPLRRKGTQLPRCLGEKIPPVIAKKAK